MAKIALSEMLQNLRAELEKALEVAEGQEIRFDLQEVTLEAQVQVSREASGKAGVKFWVFSTAEAGGKVGDTRGHKVVLKLMPRTASGGSVPLSLE